MSNKTAKIKPFHWREQYDEKVERWHYHYRDTYLCSLTSSKISGYSVFNCMTGDVTYFKVKTLAEAKKVSCERNKGNCFYFTSTS